MPADLACGRRGVTESASAAEMTIASTPFWMDALMNSACAAPVASVGPTCSHSALSSPHAFWAPTNAASKYGLLIAFGMTAIFTPVFSVGAAAAVEAAASVEAAGAAAAVSAAVVADVVLSSLDPDALTTRAAMASTARIL